MDGVVNGIGTAIVTVDATGAIRSVSAAAERLLGYAAHELLGARFAALFVEPFQSRYEQWLADRHQGAPGDRSSVSGAVKIRKASGVIEDSWLSIEEQSETPEPHYVGVFDTAAAGPRSAAQSLRQELGEVQRFNLTAAIVSGLAHEMSQPLSAGANYARAAQRMLQNESPDLALVAETCGRASDQIQRAGRTLARLRESCRRGQPTSAALDVNALVRCLVGLVEPDLRVNSISLTTVCSRGLPAVAGNFACLLDVLLNLFSNALDALRDRESHAPEVTVETRVTDDNWVEIRVCDRGPGVPPELGSEVFEPFVTSQPDRLGLGLAVCNSIVRAQGGTLSYRPNPAGGAEFTVALPGVTEPSHAV